MNKREQTYLTWRKELSKTGWDVQKADTIQFNSGSETIKHIIAKAATAHVLKANDFRVDSEVEHPERGAVDIVAVPTQEDQRPFAVELETSPTQEIVKDKVSRYVTGTPFVECYVVNLGRTPLHAIEMTEHIANELGVEL